MRERQEVNWAGWIITSIPHHSCRAGRFSNRNLVVADEVYQMSPQFTKVTNLSLMSNYAGVL